MSRRELLHAGWMGAKVLLGIAQDAIQYAVINHNGKEHEKEHTHTHTHRHRVNLLSIRN